MPILQSRLIALINAGEHYRLTIRRFRRDASEIMRLATNSRNNPGELFRLITEMYDMITRYDSQEEEFSETITLERSHFEVNAKSNIKSRDAMRTLRLKHKTITQLSADEEQIALLKFGEKTDETAKERQKLEQSDGDPPNNQPEIHFIYENFLAGLQHRFKTQNEITSVEILREAERYGLRQDQIMEQMQLLDRLEREKIIESIDGSVTDFRLISTNKSQIPNPELGGLLPDRIIGLKRKPAPRENETPE